MQDVFITKIHIRKVRHLQGIDIVLSDNERKHLILTGKNGSGKTSLLEAMKDNISSFQQVMSDKDDFVAGLMYGVGYRDDTSDVDISYSGNTEFYEDAIFVYIPAERNKLTIPESIETVRLEGKTLISKNVGRDFLKYVLNLDYRLYGAKTDNNTLLEVNLKKWFDNFLEALREIYDCRELKLKRDARNLAFNVVMPGREPFGLHEMADGYTAFLDIYMELLMRFENEENEVVYDTPAIVLIDEVETHLHVELQKRILPFLTRMFPKVQFIAVTHSPFVITSLENAIVYDLEKNIRLDGDLTEYSYTDIIEGYFDVSECSAGLKSDFDRYVELCHKDSQTATEREEMRKLFERLNKIPGTSPLSVAFFMFERGRRNCT